MPDSSSVGHKNDNRKEHIKMRQQNDHIKLLENRSQIIVGLLSPRSLEKPT
jgi:hypothetical protein